MVPSSPGTREAIALDAPEVEALMLTGRTMVLVSVGVDGAPHPVPMWYLVIDGAIWMRTYAKSQKARNLSRDPRFAALIDDGDRYASLRGVQLRGCVHLSDDADLISHIAVGLLRKYEGLAGENVAAAHAAYLSGPAAKQVAIRLDVEHTASWDHTKLVSR